MWTFNQARLLVMTCLNALLTHHINIGTQGVQDLYFFANEKPLEVVNSACQSMVFPVWFVKSDWSAQPQ